MLNMIQSPSPNFDQRPDEAKIEFLILHSMDLPDIFDSLNMLQKADPGVSAHYMIDTDGTVYKLVDEENRAFHAGVSYWGGKTGLNASSIGIEFHCHGHSTGLCGFTHEQMTAGVHLCRDIIKRHNILPQHVLAHSDIAPDRKTDPSEYFDWKFLAEHDVGLWPEIREQDLTVTPEDAPMLLEKFGYDPDQPLDVQLTAFQRHFYPEIFKRPDLVGEAEQETLRRLAALNRQKLAHRKRIA